MRKTPIIAATLVLASAYWLYRLPYNAADRVSAALKSGNKADMEDSIDFESLRSSLKDEIFATMLKNAQDSNTESPTGAMFGAGLVAGLGGMAVDALLTPSNLSVLIRNGKAGQSNGTQDASRQDLFADATYEYRSLHTFVVRKPTDNGVMECIFQRQGLSWKWTGIQLPR